jgi:hypothetical protein
MAEIQRQDETLLATLFPYKLGKIAPSAEAIALILTQV